MNTLMQNEESDILKVIESLMERFCSQDVQEDSNIWEELIILIDEVFNFIKNYQLYYKCKDVAQNLLSLMQTIVENDQLFHIVANRPFKVLFSKITLQNLNLPFWAIPMFYDHIVKYVEVSDASLRSIIKMMWKSRSFNNQKAFAQIILKHYNLSRVDSLLSNLNEDIRVLFKRMFFKKDHKSIRNYLNLLNSEEDRPHIFSVLAYQIKIGEFLSLQNTWVDFNILLKTFTFDCFRTYLSSEKHCIIYKKRCNTDTITINLKSISSLKYKRSENTDQLILYLSEPCEAHYESSVQFLEKFRMIVLFVRDNKENFRDIIYNLWYRKFEEIPTSELPYNFELNLLNNDRSETYASPTSNSIISATDSEDYVLSYRVPYLSEELVVNETQLDESAISQDASQEETSNYVSDIQKTPERMDFNIVVDDSQEAWQGDAEITAVNLDSTMLMTPSARSCNISIAETCPSPVSISSTPDSHKSSCKRNIFKSSLQSISEVIDLISPEAAVPTNIEEPIEQDVAKDMYNGLDEENIHLAISEPEVAIDLEQILSGNIDETETAEAEDIETVVESQNAQQQIEKNVRSKTFTTINIDRSDYVEETVIGDATKNQQIDNSLIQICNSGQSSAGSNKDRKRKRKYSDRYDPTYDNRNFSISPISSPPRKKLGQRRKSKDAEVYEFNNQSFFSDAETSADHTYTRTRRVKKPVKYQSDPEGRAPRRRNVSMIEKEQPPVKKIKTIPPVRRPSEQTPTGTPEQKDIDDVPLTINRSQRRLTDIHNYDHLDLIEHPDSPVFRLPVPDSTNVPQLIPQQKTPAGSPKKPSPKKISPSKSPKKSSQKKTSQVETSPKIQTNARSPKKRRYSLESGFGLDDDEGLDDITYGKIKANLERFDRIRYNIPSTQTTQKKRKKISFFSSSSNSQDSGDLLTNQTRRNDFEDDLEQIALSALEASPKTNKYKENKSPKKSNNKTKITVTGNKKVKRSPVKKICNNKSSKKGKKSKAIDEDIIEINSDSSSDISPAFRDLSNFQYQVERCEQCGALRKNTSPDMQKAIKKICELHLNTLKKSNRIKFCQNMEKFFKKKREEN